MGKTLRFFGGALIVCALAAVAPAVAQFLPGPDDSQDSGGATPKGKKTAEAQNANGPNIAGAWSGQVTQIGSEKPYKLELTVVDEAVVAFGHGGGDPGVSARVVHYPDSATTIVALCNQDRGSWAASLRIGAALGVNEPHEMPA